MSAERARLAEPAPRTLESICSSFMGSPQRLGLSADPILL
jgi:hypothetical protein